MHTRFRTIVVSGNAWPKLEQLQVL